MTTAVGDFAAPAEFTPTFGSDFAVGLHANLPSGRSRRGAQLCRPTWITLIIVNVTTDYAARQMLRKRR